MALVQLSDAVIPAVYESYTAVNNPELTAFFQSGVAVRNALLDNAFEAGGTTAHLPFWKDLDPTIEPNYSTDNPSDVAVPNKLAATEMIARIANMNQAYSAADLVVELAGSDPMRRIRDRFGTYWMRQWQRRALAIAKGVLADNIANDSSDMVNNLAVEDIALVTDANLFSRGAFTGAVFTLGDAFGGIRAMAIHSVVAKRMADEEAIVYVLPSQPSPNIPLTDQAIPTYQGKVLIIDDNMPVIAGTTSGYKYLSILFGGAAFGYGTNSPKNPSEVYREPLKGNGAGIETIIERVSWVLHPFGWSFTSSSVAGQSPTLAELALAANWDRKIDRKLIPMAFLWTNG